MKIHPATDEKELLLRLRNGEELAFKQIFDRYYKRLCVYAERFVIHNEEAEDIVGEAFLRLWNGNKDFERLEHIKASLYVSVKNIGINQHHSIVKSMERNRRFDYLNGIDSKVNSIFGLINFYIKPGYIFSTTIKKALQFIVIGALFLGLIFW